LLSLIDLFGKIQSLGSEEFNIECSYFEVYNELIFDLLNEENLDKALSIYEDASKDQFKVKGLM